jgi:hypothetical protein
LFEDAAVICVDCSALQVSAKDHLGYHFDTINGIVNAKVPYVSISPDQMYMEGKPGVGRQNPQPSSKPSGPEARTVPFNVWFIDAVCNPFKIILQNGNSKKIIVLFYDWEGEQASVAMSHLFAGSIPDVYRKSEEHLSQQNWTFGLRECANTKDRACNVCYSISAERMRAAAELQAKAVMMTNCFSLLQRPFVCKL